MPIPKRSDPLTVQLGLAYINEDDGPITDLLCAVKIVPRMIVIKPDIVIVLPMFFFSNTMTSLIDQKKNFMQPSNC